MKKNISHLFVSTFQKLIHNSLDLRLHLESPMSLKEIYGEGVFSVFPHRNRRGLQTLSRTGLRAWIQMVFWWANLWESGWMRICWTKSADFCLHVSCGFKVSERSPKIHDNDLWSCHGKVVWCFCFQLHYMTIWLAIPPFDQFEFKVSFQNEKLQF